MSSSEITSHPPIGDQKTQHDADAVKEELFKKAMQSSWQDVACIYARDKGVRGTKITWGGDTLLHLAASSGEENNVMLLMACLVEEKDKENTQKILVIQNDRGDTALHIAAALGMVGVCLAMARLHPQMVVKILNERKETPLFKAVRHGQKKAFFALQSVVETHIVPPPLGEGLRTDGGDTILHNAIFTEHFDLALEIIHQYPDLVNAMNEKGESPLHVLANKPSAFKSGSRFSLLDSVIYYCTFVDPLEVQYPRCKEKVSKTKSLDYVQTPPDGNHKLPDNYQERYNIFTLLKHIFKNIMAAWTNCTNEKSKHVMDVEIETQAPRTSGEDDKPKHIMDVEIEIQEPWTNDNDDRPKHSTNVKILDPVRSIGTTDKGGPENGAKADQNGSQNHRRYLKNYYTCFEFFKLAVKFLLIIIGIGLWRVQSMKKKKKKNTHAFQIMEELVHRLKAWHYGKDGTKPSEPGATQGVDLPTTPAEMPPEVGDEPKKPTSQTIQDKLFNKLVDFYSKQVEDDSKQKPVGATPILVAAKRGVTEMVEKILEDIPVAALDLDQDEKNIVLLAVENRQPRVYELMLKRKLMKNTVFGAVDKDGNSALHWAARHGQKRPWLIPGAALQMQWEIKWYKYVLNSMALEFFMQHNSQGETASEIFTSSHESLVKDAGKWLNNTAQSCSVVAALIATVAFTSATTVPGGVNQESGFPIFEGKPAFQVFALSALIALCFSVTSLVMFLSILTSRFQERDFEKDLPVKLIIGLTTLFTSIGANLVSFCGGHFFVIEQKLKYAAYPIYAVVCLPITFFAVAQFPLYIDLIKATFAEVPERTQRLHPF